MREGGFPLYSSMMFSVTPITDISALQVGVVTYASRTRAAVL